MSSKMRKIRPVVRLSRRVKTMRRMRPFRFRYPALASLARVHRSLRHFMTWSAYSPIELMEGRASGQRRFKRKAA